MSILKIAKLGNPVLRQVGKPVPADKVTGPEVQRLIQDMIETMREYEGVGLAAPQVHESRQIMVIEALGDPKNSKEEATPLMVLINPVLSVVSERTVEDWEGCLSLPDMRGMVPRYQEIKVQALDPSGKIVNLHAKNFLARVVQHEHDHLIGKVFVERMKSFATLTHLKEYAKFWHKEED